MSASSTSLNRARSLRKPAGPAAEGDEFAQKDAETAPTSRNTSPSRLPVKLPTRPIGAGTGTGAPNSSSGSGSNGATSTTAGSVLKSSRPAGRPISAMYPRPTSTRQPPPGLDVVEPAKHGGASRRQAAPPVSSGSSSSTTVSRPTTSSGLPSAAGSAPAAKPRAAAHSRAKSSATALTAATILRPPSQSSSVTPPMAAPAVPSSSSSASSSTVITSSRPPLSRTNLRPASHTRQLSGSGSHAGPTKQPAKPPTPTEQHHPPTRQQQQQQQQQQPPPPPRLRPAFTTLQQHYSPAKSLAPKPLTASFLAPPSPSKLPANVAASAETARLQAELLQLHLLHRGAAAADSAWRASAKRRLGERFAALGAESGGLGREEARVAERGNIRALTTWGGAAVGGRGGLEEKVQALDLIVSGLWGMGESGGRYARVVRRFERWVERTVEVVDARRKGGAAVTGEGGEVVFVRELDEAWKEECAGLVRRLEGWRRQLRELGDVPGDATVDAVPAGQPSSLARILGGCRDLVEDMLTELGVMEAIERDALAQEAEWIHGMGVDDDDGVDDTPRAGAIWRAF